MTIARIRFGTRYVPVHDEDPDPVLGRGELGIDETTGEQKVGDDETSWDDLEGFPIDGGQL